VSQIMVVPEAVQNAGSRIQQISLEIENQINQLRMIAGSIQDEWQGMASSAFEGAMGDWNAAAVNIQNAASSIGRATAVAGTNYSDTEAANTSMFK
jgi:6 kDa early secretory antigenic target